MGQPVIQSHLFLRRYTKKGVFKTLLGVEDHALLLVIILIVIIRVNFSRVLTKFLGHLHITVITIVSLKESDIICL